MDLAIELWEEAILGLSLPAGDRRAHRALRGARNFTSNSFVLRNRRKLLTMR